VPNLTNITARHAHFVEQFKNGQVKNFMPFLNRVATRMRAELLKTDTVISRARIESKLAFVDALISSEFKTYTDELQGQLGLFVEEEAEFTAASLNKVQSLAAATIPSTSQLKAAINARPFNNRLLKDYLNDFSKDQAKAVKNAVSMGFFEGKSTRDIIKDVIGSKSLGYKNGLLNVSRTSAERMVRTSIAHTASVAKSYTLEENIDIIPYYEWSSILDGRTSSICQAGDGTVYPVGKGPLAPHHYNCRSVEVPMFADEVELKNGKPVKIDTTGAEQNYNTWLSKQSNKFQNEVLGTKKAELYRKGGLSVDKFVNNAGQTLTLGQLKTKYPTAWDKANT
jgi:SPP1 gp7 family putative phage head morphogenesis protein